MAQLDLNDAEAAAWGQIAQVARALARKDTALQDDDMLPHPDKSKAKAEILAAHYGGQDVTTLATQQFIHGDNIVISTSELACGDPWKGILKSFSVIYRFNDGKIRGLVVPESDGKFTLSPDGQVSEGESVAFVASNHSPPFPTPIEIHSVIYGKSQVEDEEVYKKLYYKFTRNDPIPITNEFFNKDPWFNVVKSAAIVYSFNGTVRSISGREGDDILFAL
ncbi:hypothetical protein G7Z17_g695 [Cylindrodendrum hubeiense]|uniref:Uncharacterized protein n=1 Tax=Cylindrodendrum hubeiense TaxID=595255 RepID=A0A9P5HGC1_9HYPO|nr:hypothetical protein G7Z17_g695 [Cylindrodendrum hubeiense]